MTLPEDVITLEQVSKTIGERQIVNDVSFSVKSGDIFGFLGPNGAGKTTSIRIMLGLLGPTSGRATLLGQDPRDGRARQKVGFVLEIDGLYDNISARDNLAFYSRIYGLDRQEERIEAALEVAGLVDRGDDKVGTYSKGMRQRLALGRALLQDPEVVILDEPTAGVDPTGQVEMRDVLLRLAQEGHNTVFLSSHNLDEVQRICNRIALIHRGKIRLFGALRELEGKMGHAEVLVEAASPFPSEVLAELRDRLGAEVEIVNERAIAVTATASIDVPDMVAWLVSTGIGIEQVKRQAATLEDLYLSIVNEAETR
jgi:ABC-2 type transport system ATP-binding protein